MQFTLNKILNESGEGLMNLADKLPYKKAIGTTLLALSMAGLIANDYVSRQSADVERRIVNCFVKPIMEGEFPSKYYREQYKPDTYDAMGKSYFSGHPLGDLMNNGAILHDVADEGSRRRSELEEKFRNELRDGRLKIPDNCK